MAILDQLEPKSLFHYFEQLCAIPHGSGNTEAAGAWLASFAAERGLEHWRDEAGNVVIIGKASPGYEEAPTVILQGHMDMVCEKDPDCPLDMEREGLDLAVDGDFVFARGSTLGGDDGVAVAMMLAILDAPALEHPRLECVFTADEEVGMLGAEALDASPLRGRILLNLDSEDEGVFTVSCAGGRLVRCVLPVKREAFPGVALDIVVRGLTGGHSGIEIHRGGANASVLLGRVLASLRRATPARVTQVHGGLKDNAIPVLAQAQVVVADAAAAAEVCRDCEAMFRAEYAATDPHIEVLAAPGEPGTPMDERGSADTVCLLLCQPNGVQAMSAFDPGLVETSLNLGILTTEADCVCAAYCVRSSVESRKELLTERLRSLTERLGGRIETSGDYPGWAFRSDSPLRETMVEVFREQYGREPVISAIHAGLECGLFAGKLPGLDCVSIGPQLEGIHTPRERMSVSSVARTWALVTETLKRMK